MSNSITEDIVTASGLGAFIIMAIASPLAAGVYVASVLILHFLKYN